MANINYTITASAPPVKVDLIQITPTPVGDGIISTITYPDTPSDPEIINGNFVVDIENNTTYQIKATDNINHIVTYDNILVSGNTYSRIIDSDGKYFVTSNNENYIIYNK